MRLAAFLNTPDRRRRDEQGKSEPKLVGSDSKFKN